MNQKMMRDHIVWTRGPNTPNLKHNMVHIWRITLPITESLTTKFKKTLSADENLRVDNFRFKAQREQSIASRGGLRNILSRYIDMPPENIQFSYTSCGKPYLDYTELTFNTSHTGKDIVYAITKKVCIGIDIEQIKIDIDFLSIAKTIFTEEEYIKFSMIPAQEKPLAFYRYWTRKEAFLKAIGTGLHYPLNQVNVSFTPLEEPQLLHTEIHPFELNAWKIDEFFLNEDHIISIATRQKHYQINLWDWNI